MDRPSDHSSLRKLQHWLVSPWVWHPVFHPTTRYIVAWLVALVTMSAVFYSAWHAFDQPGRNDYRPPSDPLPDIKPDRLYAGALPVLGGRTAGLLGSPLGQGPLLAASALIPVRSHGGNTGHTEIDFGGQYLMGRMLVVGHGRQIYNRSRQRQVLLAVFPREDEDPNPPAGYPTRASDVEQLMSWTMGTDDPAAVASMVMPLSAGDALQLAALAACGYEATTANGEKAWAPQRLEEAVANRGGPLYPPVNALYMAPFALLPARAAYRADQLFHVLLTFLCGFALRQISAGRVWWPVAVAAVIAFPGYLGSIQLGQNALLTLTILLCGWALVARGRPGWAGVVWGLLAFKPVWALSFFLVPVLTRRWRMCLAMAGTGVTLAAATLPFVGVGAWIDWLKVGREASALYDVDYNWVFLSRDLLSIPRRWLLDFNVLPKADRAKDNWFAPMLLGWALLFFVLEITTRLTVLRDAQARRAVTGPPAAFIVLGAWMLCFHFMYYDVLLAAFPVFLLLTEPRRLLDRAFILLTTRPRFPFLSVRPLAGQLPEGFAEYYRPRLAQDYPPAVLILGIRPRNVWVLNSMVLYLIVLLLMTAFLFPLVGLGHQAGTPWDTFCLMALWLWCGWRWLWMRDEVNGRAGWRKPPVGGFDDTTSGVA